MVRRERLQLQSADIGVNMIFNRGFVGTEGGWLDVTKILFLPHVQLWADGQLAWRNIISFVNGIGDRFELLRNLFLRLAGDGFLNLFPGAGVETIGIPSLPIDIFLTTPLDYFLSNCTATGGRSFATCHRITLLFYELLVAQPYRQMPKMSRENRMNFL